MAENMSNTFKISEYTTIKESTNSSVNHPKHYNVGAIEVIDAIEDWNLGFNKGNAIKYIARSEYKGNEIEDLEKAVWYLNREIENKKLKKELEEAKAEGTV